MKRQGSRTHELCSLGEFQPVILQHHRIRGLSFAVFLFHFLYINGLFQWIMVNRLLDRSDKQSLWPHEWIWSPQGYHTSQPGLNYSQVIATTSQDLLRLSRPASLWRHFGHDAYFGQTPSDTQGYPGQLNP